MSNGQSGAGGFGVDPAQIRKVAGDYRSEGDTVVQARAKATTGIGSGQVGQRYADVAAPYQRVFQQFGQILAGMGNKMIETAGSLGAVAGHYTQTESMNAREVGSVS